MSSPRRLEVEFFRALLLQPGSRSRLPRSLPPAVRWFASLVAPYTHLSWTFAILVPQPRVQAKRSQCSYTGWGSERPRGASR